MNNKEHIQEILRIQFNETSMTILNLLYQSKKLDQVALFKQFKDKTQRESSISNNIDYENEIEVAGDKNFHRIIKRLRDHDLIYLDLDGKLFVSTLGISAISMNQYRYFLDKHKKFFLTHDLSSLPSQYIKTIDVLSNATPFCESNSLVPEIWSKIYRDANEYVKTLLTFSSTDNIRAIVETLQKNNGNDEYNQNNKEIKFKFSYVMQEYTLVPKDRNQILEANKWDQKIHNGIIRRKMIDFLPVALVVNDKNQYAISFLDLHQNRIDLSSCFYGNDSEAHDWCENLFYHYWKTSTEWDESKIKTVDFESLSKKR